MAFWPCSICLQDLGHWGWDMEVFLRGKENVMRKRSLALLVALAIGGLGLVTSVPIQAAEKAASAVATELRVNVNTADVEQLTQLKGVGEKTAQAIIDFRKTNGSFKTVDDLLQIKGIGEKRLATMRGNIVLE